MPNEIEMNGWSPQGPVTEFTQDHAWELLGTQSLGRDGSTILFRTAVGAKLTNLIRNRHVAFEADSVTDTEAWSVVARGTARVLVDVTEISCADSRVLPHWIPTADFVYVSVTPTDIRARHFDRRLHATRR